LIALQKKRLGTRRGFIAAKPNCSIQSYVPLLQPLMEFEPTELFITTYQAISGAGKTFNEWPEMLDNIIPFIGGEEEKSEKEPLKIWGQIGENGVEDLSTLTISAQCLRVPCTDGHMAAVFVRFGKKPTEEEILDRWNQYASLPQKLELPSAPKQFITYFEDPSHPQTGLDRMTENGMGICAGRLREDPIYDYKFVGLSHNTLRGAAGGAVEVAELLFRLGYFDR
jgi:aspartate-semialdehyde dehydrogenase